MEKVKQYIFNQMLSKNLSKQEAAGLLEEIIQAGKVDLRLSANDDIAVIGMSCRFSQAAELKEFWQLIMDGKDAVASFEANRQKDVEDYIAQKLHIKQQELRFMPGGYLADIDMFDNELFNITPGEARLMDPQQRIFLELVWRAMEDAQLCKNDIEGTQTGIYVGFSENQYGEMNSLYNPSARIGNLSSMIAGRAAYSFDLHGPAQTIDTTCSSGLVAVHNACQAILQGECDLAIAGGVKLVLFPVQLERFGVRTESQDFRCKAFSEDADGIVSSEGAAVLFLKRFDKAVADGNKIYAIIKGSAVNADGRSNGIASPNAKSQSEVIDRAWQKSKIDPLDLMYIEAHGTGTKLGDPIEIDGISAAFRRYTGKRQFCAIGSVKSNIGHTDSVAGLAGLVKLILAIQQGMIPASLHAAKENSLIPFDETPVYVNQKTTMWPANDKPRLGGVSSFGLSGTNCHMVVSQHVCKEKKFLSKSICLHGLFVISANDEHGLHAYLKQYVEFLKHANSDQFYSICYSSQTTRTALGCRLAVIAAQEQELLDKICRVIECFNTYPSNGDICIEGVYTNFCSYIDSSAFDSTLINVAKIFVNGATPDWGSLYYDELPNKISLPYYPFQRRRHWISDDTQDPLRLHIQKDATSVQFADWYYQQKWVERESSDINWDLLVHQGIWIVYSETSSLCDRLKEFVSGADIRIIEVSVGEAFQKMNENHYRIRPGNLEDTMKMLGDMGTDALRKLRHVIHAWVSLDASITIGDSLFDVRGSVSRGASTLLCLVKGLADQCAENWLDIWVLSGRFNGPMEKEVLPVNATLWGMCRVIPQEFPKMSCYCIEYDSMDNNVSNISEMLMKNIMTKRENRDYIVSYRDSQRYVQQIEKLDLGPKILNRPPVREGGTYLLFGGGGYLGLRMSLAIAMLVKTRFILVNRTTFPPPNTWNDLLKTDIDYKLRFQIEHICAIEQAGSEVVIITADGTDEASIEKLSDSLSEYTPIHGVIQATKNTHNQLIRDISINSFNEAIIDKIASTVYIDRIVERYKPDFYLLLSSISSIIGGKERVDCAAANRFLDTYTFFKKRSHTTIYNMNLPGILSKRIESHEQEFQAFPGMYVEDFTKCLIEVLSHEIPFIILENFQLEEVKKILKFVRTQFDKNLFTVDEVSGIPLGTKNQQINGEEESQPKFQPQNIDALHATLENIWAKVLGYTSVDLERDFFDMGGDSLMAINMFDNIKDSIGIEMDVADIFSYPTIRKMAKYIAEKHKFFIDKTKSDDTLMDILSKVEDNQLSYDDALSLLLDETLS